MMDMSALADTTESPANAEPADVPIFILGIMPRSGTHFLANLLCLHPDCTKSALPEDLLVSESALLRRYTICSAGNGLSRPRGLIRRYQIFCLRVLGKGFLPF